MRVCLIRCPSPFLIDDKVFPPLGLMAVGTVLKERGYDVHIHDGSIESIPMDFNHYGLGPTTPEYPSALEALRLIRKSNSKAMVTIGGPHANADCKDLFDEVIEGAVCYDSLIIDRSLLDVRSYKYYIDGHLATTMVTASGCPYKCAFCSKGPSFKARDVDLVIKEIETLRFDLDYKAIMFFDDTFILDKIRVMQICDCLKQMNMVWRCFVRADLVIKHGLDLLDVMADSGCVEVGMGIESGSNTILSNINKGETVEEIKEAIGMIQGKGIRVKGFFIIGLPGESVDTIDATHSFLDDVSLDDADFTVFQPYPGGDIYKNKEQYDIDWDTLDRSEMFYKGKPGESSCFVRTSALSAGQLIESRNRLEEAYGQI